MIKRVHRWLGLAAAAFWLLQALTGTLIVFRWELDDAMLPGAAAAADPAALGSRIEQLRAEGSEVSSMWTSSGPADRFDIFHARGGVDHATRVNGAGDVLRDRAGDTLADGGVWDALTRTHQNLLQGDVGKWIVAVSGALLLSNLILGLKLAWPRRGGARGAMLTAPRGPVQARTYAWHRLLGLWAGIPAVVMVTAGLLLVFHGEVESALGVEHAPAAAPSVPAGGGIGPGEAMRLALARYPAARISGVSLPSAESPQYRIRLNVPGETGRIYGATTVVLAQADGRVLLDHDARRPGAGRWFNDTLYPFHTGQMAGPVGRLMVTALGLWLITITSLGVLLWFRRRAPRRP